MAGGVDLDLKQDLDIKIVKQIQNYQQKLQIDIDGVELKDLQKEYNWNDQQLIIAEQTLIILKKNASLTNKDKQLMKHRTQIRRYW